MTNKENFEEYSAFLGFVRRRRRPNGTWYVKIIWGRVMAAALALAFLGWMALSTFLYIFWKYVNKYDEMTFWQAMIYPFSQAEQREKIGNFHIKKSRELLEAKKFREAIQTLTVGVARSPKNIEGRRMLAEFYLVFFKRPDHAINMLEGGLIFAKDDPQYIRLYLRLLLEQNDDKRIVAVGEKLLNDADIKNMQAKSYIAITLATVYAMHGNYKMSREYIEKYGLAETLPGVMRLAKNEWEMGDRNAAIDLILKNLNKMEKKEFLYGMLVNFYMEMGNIDEARRYSVLRSIENPFSIEQKIEFLRLLKKSGDDKRVMQEIDTLFNQYKDDNRSLLNLANFATDVCDVEFMRRIYNSALNSGFPMAPYCLLWLESMIANKNYKDATKFSEDIMREKPVWIKQYEDIFSCLRAIAYYGSSNIGMSEALIDEVLKRGKVSPRVLFSTARRFEDLGALNFSMRLLSDAVERFPRHQLALTNLIRLEIESGNAVNLDKHINTLLQMRRPSRSLVEYARDNLISDKFIFAKNRKKTIDEINSMMVNKSLDQNPDSDKDYGCISDPILEGSGI